ncbi:MAG: zinc ribbon domain-containing protein [Asgard group archaeon]|nr:zinc ribbon domain-containing protein [Asgard group archaeon]
MFDRSDNPDGIFVLNGQVFSVNDLIAVMRRHGIRIRLNRDGLSVDGEQITSISNLDSNKCPLAKSCDKLSALMDFLKLQKSQESRERAYDRRDSVEPPYIQDSQQDYRDDFREDYRRDKSKRSDFIKPNNHDLFEGNVSNSQGLFDEPSPPESQGLFDEPSYSNDKDNSLFEDSLFRQDDYEEPEYSRDNQFQDRSYKDDSRVQDQLFCQKCGFDVDSNWNSCPRCGQRIAQNNRQKTFDTLF